MIIIIPNCECGTAGYINKPQGKTTAYSLAHTICSLSSSLSHAYY